MTAIDDRGRLAIPDAQGEVFAYAVRPADAGRDDFACELERQDTGDSYRVSLSPDGRWACECNARKYRAGPHGAAGSCKHIEAVAPLRALLLKWSDHMARTPPKGCSSTAPPDTADDLAARLGAPFDPTEVKFKPQTISGNRALAVPFVDARVVQDRLDDAVGVSNWQSTFREMPDGTVVCRLSLRIAGEWVPKEDVGAPSEQPDDGDKRKAAFSDALKRAAVQWGIGRYLYRLKPQWVDYDPQKRQFTRQPTLPASALPKQPPATGAQVERIDELTRELRVTPGEYEAAMAARGVRSADELTHAQAADVIGKLEAKLARQAPAGAK